MNRAAARFPIDGYVVLDDLLSAPEVAQVVANLDEACDASAGDRRFLDREWCRLVAHVVRHRLLKRRLLMPATQPVACTLFDTSGTTNCAVGLHRDLHLPLAHRFEHPHWGDWDEKQRIPYARAPRAVLSNLLAVRVHVEACSAESGALDVVPGSHTDFDIAAPRITCAGAPGSALVMTPLLLHGSRRSTCAHARRVLHFLFGPRVLPDGAAWYYKP